MPLPVGQTRVLTHASSHTGGAFPRTRTPTPAKTRERSGLAGRPRWCCLWFAGCSAAGQLGGWRWRPCAAPSPRRRAGRRSRRTCSSTRTVRRGGRVPRRRGGCPWRGGLALQGRTKPSRVPARCQRPVPRLAATPLRLGLRCRYGRAPPGPTATPRRLAAQAPSAGLRATGNLAVIRHRRRRRGVGVGVRAAPRSERRWISRRWEEGGVG